MTDIVTPPTIPAMPPAPLLTDTQADFNSKAFSTVQAWPNFIVQTNGAASAAHQNATAAQERAASAGASATSAAGSSTAAAAARDLAQAFAQSAISAPGTSGTSTSALAIGSGAKSLTTQAGKAWVAGQAIVVAAAAAPTTQRMYGVITSYDPGTGALSFDVPAGAFAGSGTTAAWIVSLTASREGLVVLGAGPNQLPNRISLGMHTGGGTIRVSVDGVDFGVILTDAQVRSICPPGMCCMWPGATPPPGWLKRNGAAISRTGYAALFAEIGTIYGAGDGVSTFNLPDDRGLVDRGLDEGRGLDPGRVLGSYQESQNKDHFHTGTTESGGVHQHPYWGAPQTNGAGGAATRLADNLSLENTEFAGAHAHNFTTSSSGGAEVRMRNSAKIPVIKY